MALCVDQCDLKNKRDNYNEDINILSTDDSTESDYFSCTSTDDKDDLTSDCITCYEESEITSTSFDSSSDNLSDSESYSYYSYSETDTSSTSISVTCMHKKGFHKKRKRPPPKCVRTKTFPGVSESDSPLSTDSCSNDDDISSDRSEGEYNESHSRRRSIRSRNFNSSVSTASYCQIL